MTHFSKHEVINNLRDKNRELKDKIKATKNKLLEWDNIHMRDKHAAPSILEDMFKILLEGEK